MGKKKKVFHQIEIQDVAAKGKSIARIDDMVIFVRDTIPGDIVDIKITKKKKNYQEGKPIHFHEHALNKQTPFCEHFHLCGGCTWQTLTYEDQLYYKAKEVKDNLERIGKIDTSTAHPILPSQSDRYYRNKMEFTFSSKRWLTKEEVATKGDIAEKELKGIGLHIPGQFDKVVDINHCHLQPAPSNDIRLAVKHFSAEKGFSFHDPVEQTGYLRNLLIRTSRNGEVMVVMVFREDDEKSRSALLDHLVEKFPSLSSVMYMINPKKNDSLYDLEAELHHGKDHIIEEMEGLKFKIGPKSFFQTNPEQGERLYAKVRDLAGLTGAETVFDLYTGTGTIANFLAPSASHVVGIESVPEAIEDARENAELNGLTNTTFFTGDMKDFINSTELQKFGSPDVLITDPPRAGMHKDVVKRMLDLSPSRIVYVSCNPATQARDAEMLSEQYEVKAIQPVDMFPQTYHVENILLLEKRS